MIRLEPIPDACFRDPLWTGKLSDLANTMIICGAKPKLVSRYTGLSAKILCERYRKLTGSDVPNERLRIPNARQFASNRGSLLFNLQAAAFAGILIRLEDSLGGMPVNRGWLLTAAYITYQQLIEPSLKNEPDLPILSITQGYQLMTHLGVGIGRKSPELLLVDCQTCGAKYLVHTQSEPDTQHCSICSINRRYVHLRENSRSISKRRQSL